MAILYFLCCVLQPICLPFPEMVTILGGERILGENGSFVIGVIGVTIGIAIMYTLSNKASQWLISHLKCQKKIDKFQDYVNRYKILIIGFLFVVPILPDEIICIGAPIIGIKMGYFMLIAFLSKIVSVGMVSYSKEVAKVFSIGTIEILLIELVILLGVAAVFQLLDQRKANQIQEK